MIRRDSAIIFTISLLNKNKLVGINLQHNIDIFIYFSHVCDVITPEVEIGGKVNQNDTLISYNLYRYGFCVTSKVTNLWTKILLEYGVVFGRNGYSEVALYIFLNPNFEDRSTICFA